MQHPLGLKKMTAFMPDNDQEPSTGGESNSRVERIPKANAVYVFRARPCYEFAAGFVSGAKAFKNGSVDVRRWSHLRRSRSSLGGRRRLDKTTNKPAPEPSGNNLLYWKIRFPVDRRRDSRQIGFVRDAENARGTGPHSKSRVPIAN
jgi:hypothetical protein